jgi:light-harvesting protein B-800-850 alpha chain
MNQKEIWLVVKPTVGLPLLLGSVAVTALLVHYSILSHTTWFSGYWEGGAKAKSEAVSMAPAAAPMAAPMAAAPMAAAPAAAPAAK